MRNVHAVQLILLMYTMFLVKIRIKLTGKHWQYNRGFYLEAYHIMKYRKWKFGMKKAWQLIKICLAVRKHCATTTPKYLCDIYIDIFIVPLAICLWRNSVMAIYPWHLNNIIRYVTFVKFARVSIANFELKSITPIALGFRLVIEGSWVQALLGECYFPLHKKSIGSKTTVDSR